MKFNLYYERVDNAWSQKSVSKVLGISQTYYSMIENGSRAPSFPLIKKLEDLFECSHIYLLGFRESKDVNEKESQRSTLKNECMGDYSMMDDP